MKAFQQIPDTYHECARIDLQKDKRTSLLVNILAFVTMVLMTMGMTFFRPIKALFDMSQGLGVYALRFVALILGYILYIVLHELTHACMMRLAGGQDVQFGFTGMYAYAGSEQDYFDKSSYLCIALAPLVIWFILLALLGSVMPPDWFWVVYLLQMGNVAGSAGDVYVAFRVLPMPKDLLVMDTGVRMMMLTKEFRNRSSDANE